MQDFRRLRVWESAHALLLAIKEAVRSLPKTVPSDSRSQLIRAADSIVSFRLHSENPSTQMPPISRSVAHDEAVAIVDDWISSVVDGRYESAGCTP